MDILKKAAEFSKEFKESSFYKDYIESKQSLFDDKEAAFKFNEFIKVRDKFSSSLMTGKKPTIEEEKYISSIYSDALSNDKIRLFMSAEKNLLKTIDDVFKIIFDDLDFMPEKGAQNG